MKLPEWTDTIQFRLMVAFAALLALSTFTVSLWATNTSRLAINRFESDMNAAREERARQLLLDVFMEDMDLYHLRISVQQIARLFDKRVAVVDEGGVVIVDSHKPAIGQHDVSANIFDSAEFRSVPLELGDAGNCNVIFMDPGDLPHPEFEFLNFEENSNQTSSQPDGTQQILSSDQEAVVTTEPPPSASNVVERNRLSSEVVEDVIQGSATQSPMEPTLSALQDEFRRSLLLSGVTGGLAGLLLIVFLTRKAFDPMRDLTEAAQRLGQGDLDQRVRSGNRGEVGKLATAFNSMASELQSSETRRRRFTADIAHELRTPLSNIRGYLEAIKDGVVDSEDETIETLHLETLHLSALVDDLRLLAMTDAGALKLNKQPDCVAAVVTDVVQAFRPRAIESNVQLRSEIEPQLPPVEFDRTRIKQVVENLLNNAIEHSVPGGAILVLVSTSGYASGVEIKVTDNGHGIPDADIEHIFDQFYRVDSSRARSTGGVGLGLTIVKRMVEAHGGVISVESSVGVGSTFSVVLPRLKTSVEVG